jgi:CheY-like chemotaxis protein
MNPSELRVLVIEDDADSEMVLSSTLEYGGIKAYTASSAEEAFNLLPQVNPNLLLVDLALPGMDGWTFLENIRAHPRYQHIPAVVVSAYLNPMVAQKALQAGFLACFPKPIDTTSLVRELVLLVSQV